MIESDGDWKRRVLEDLRQWLDQVGEEPPEDEEPAATGAICSPSSRCCGRRSDCRTASTARQAARYDEMLAAFGTVSPERPRIAVSSRPSRCGTRWCEVATPRSGCASGPAGSGGRRVASTASSKATS